MEKKFDLLCSLAEGEDKVDEMLLQIRTDEFDLSGTLDLFASADHETLWKGLYDLATNGIEKVCSVDEQTEYVPILEEGKLTTRQHT
jgi:hypothetical protein